jgi:hypothetical protein
LAQRSDVEIRVRPLSGGFGSYRFDAISLDGRFILVVSWHSGFLFSPRYYDEILELRERGGMQPDEEGVDLADPTNHGAFTLALYDRGRTAAYVIVEAPLVRGGSDPWFPLLHAGEAGIAAEPPPAGATLGVGENRVTRSPDGIYRIEFADRSKWLRTIVEGELQVRPLTSGSGVIPISAGTAEEEGAGHAWQIIASRTEVSGTIRWRDPIHRRHQVSFQGLGYLDRSAGRLPLSRDLGRWLWGRYQGTEKTIAYYRLDPADAPLFSNGHGNSVDRPGEAGEFLYHGDRKGGELLEGGRIVPHHIRRNRWGMPHPLEIRGRGGGLEWQTKVIRIVDRGPFFLRCLSRLRCEDPALDEVIGISECFLPARWDVPLYRLVARGRIRRGP